MDSNAKLAMLKTMLGLSDTSQDALLGVYLTLSRDEILSWMYSTAGGVPESVTDVPAQYEPTQIMACVIGYNTNGVEGQTSHSENSISRQFAYPEMVAYIRLNVFPLAGVV